MSDPVNLTEKRSRRERKKRSDENQWSVADAIRDLVYDFEHQDDPDSLFRGGEVVEIYIALRRKEEGGTMSAFPSYSGSSENADDRLRILGLLSQHLHDVASK